MKKLIVIVIASMVMFSCEKQASNKLAPMDGIEFKAKYGFELPFLDYGNSAARSDRANPKANAVTLSVIDGDLVLSNVSGSDYTSTVSVNAEWGGYQNLTDTVSYCPRNWSTVAPPPNMDCNVTATGVILRTFTSDKKGSATEYDVHLSNRLPI